MFPVSDSWPCLSRAKILRIIYFPKGTRVQKPRAVTYAHTYSLNPFSAVCLSYVIGVDTYLLQVKTCCCKQAAGTLQRDISHFPPLLPSLSWTLSIVCFEKCLNLKTIKITTFRAVFLLSIREVTGSYLNPQNGYHI